MTHGPLTYEEFAEYLRDEGVTFNVMSKRWLQYQRVKGMPVSLDPAGRVRIDPPVAAAWLQKFSADEVVRPQSWHHKLRLRLSEWIKP